MMLLKHPACIIYSYVFYAETVVIFSRVANFLVSSLRQHSASHRVLFNRWSKILDLCCSYHLV